MISKKINLKYMTYVFLGILMLLFTLPKITFYAVSALGINALIAENLYYVLNAVSWGTLVISIVAGAGLGTSLALAIWQAVRKKSMSVFVKW